MKDFNAIKEMSHSHPIILFDGVCNLCNSWVHFLIRRDDDKIFRFLTLQSKTGQEIKKKLKLNFDSINTVILLKNGKYYVKSEVVFELIEYLSPVYKVFYTFRVLPISFRDWVYDRIASVRYKIFGKKEKCEMPDPNVVSFFLKDD